MLVAEKEFMNIFGDAERPRIDFQPVREHNVNIDINNIKTL